MSETVCPNAGSKNFPGIARNILSPKDMSPDVEVFYLEGAFDSMEFICGGLVVDNDKKKPVSGTQQGDRGDA